MINLTRITGIMPMSGRAHRIMPVIRTCRTCTLIARDEAFLRLN